MKKHPTNPTNPYGASKLMSEQMIYWFAKVYGWHYVILRYFNICRASEDGLLGDSKKPSVLLVQNAVRGALGIEPFRLTCPRVKTPDQTPIRDYLHVLDLADAHLAALRYLSRGMGDTFNLGTGKGNSVLEVIQAVKKVTGTDFQISSTTPRQGEYAKVFADNALAQQKLNWYPKRNLLDAVVSLVRWYQGHPRGWSK